MAGGGNLVLELMAGGGNLVLKLMPKSGQLGSHRGDIRPCGHFFAQSLIQTICQGPCLTFVHPAGREAIDICQLVERQHGHDKKLVLRRIAIKPRRSIPFIRTR
jgi:hypothetical protein